MTVTTTIVGPVTVQGTVTANLGGTSGLALDATLTGGTLRGIARGGAKGTTAAADITSNPVDANTQAIHATLVGTQASVPVTGTFFQATQPVSLTSLPALAAGTAAIGTVGVTALPALPAGTNAIGTVALGAGSASIGSVSNIPANADNIVAVPAFSAAAAGVNGADQTNLTARGVKVIINVTAITGTTPSLTVYIQGKDPVSGVYFNLLVSAALTAVGTTVLTLYPGLAAAANAVANDVLPKTWRVATVISGTTPAVTATIGASLII